MCTALTYNWEFLHLCTFAACACLPAACASQPAYCVCTCLPAACACASQPANCACQPGACACTCQPAACDKLQFSNGWKWRHCRWQFAPALHQKRQSPKIRKYQQKNTKYIIKKIQNSACSCTELRRDWSARSQIWDQSCLPSKTNLNSSALLLLLDESNKSYLWKHQLHPI